MADPPATAGTLKRAAKRLRPVAIAYYVLTNLRARFSSRIAHMGQSEKVSVEESVDYIESVFARLLHHWGRSPHELEDTRVLELGPGDNYGFALRMIGAGAQQVVLLDKFRVARDPAREQAIYRALLDRLEGEEKERAEASVSFGARAEFDQARIRVLEDLAVEEAPEVLPPASFDLIISIAVLEHVYDPHASLDAMDRLLKPGGFLLHEVDLRDHEMFTAAGSHPLTFLTFSPATWRLMTRDSGRPNRFLVHWYREQTARLGYDTRLTAVLGIGSDDRIAVDVTSPGGLAGSEERALVTAIRPRLAKHFRDLPDDDLATAGIFIVARKSSTGPTRAGV